ncbi:hypothetical protein B0H16DRAFT_1562013 [Mycena metata]|uniref:Uncharacterized protein n=1 Tax=Mycena metata TaxID=1033252 RepID=A0AAD7N2Q3_9AGAR|nr:hypothetical protein B0H16DRAFT_1562013 [Mycena metata]
MTDEASSTALEIHVLVPGQTASDTLETIVPPLKDGVRFRSVQRNPRASAGPSHLEAGNQHQVSSSGDSDGSDIIRTLQDLLSFAKDLFLFFFSEICTNLLLFRQPIAYASELRPLVEQAQICGDEARSLLCTVNGDPNLSTPSSVRSFQKSWKRYLEGKNEEWNAAAGEVVFLAAFIFAAVQFAEKNDPATRIFAFVAVEDLAFSFMVSQLLSRHLPKRRIEDLHYGFHLLERADAESSCMWNIPTLLSISGASTWWSRILSLVTFASAVYHFTATNDSNADSTVSLELWQMITARVVMGAIFLISGSCLISMQRTLKGYGTAVDHAPLLSPEPPDTSSQVTSETGKGHLP